MASKKNRVASHYEIEEKATERNRVANHSEIKKKIKDANGDMSQISFLYQGIIKCNW